MRLVLNDRVDLFVEMKRVRVDRVELLSRQIGEGLRRWVAGGRQRVDASLGLDAVGHGGDVSSLDEGAIKYQIAVSRRLDDEIALGRQLAGIAWRNEQILAALALVGTGESHIGHPAEIGVVDRTENARRRFDNHRSILEVQALKHIFRGGLRREEQDD